jgi:hypothetical protein
MYSLDKGIFLEDSKVLLEWGKPINIIASKNNAKIVSKPDRTIIEWGHHTILEGLKLELTSTYLKVSGWGLSKDFNTISSWAVGDNEAKSHFEMVSNHLSLKLGNPSEKEKNENIIGEEFWVWNIGEVNIILNLFEQHAYKCCLIIERKTNLTIA